MDLIYLQPKVCILFARASRDPQAKIKLKNSGILNTLWNSLTSKQEECSVPLKRRVGPKLSHFRIIFMCQRSSPHFWQFPALVTSIFTLFPYCSSWGHFVKRSSGSIFHIVTAETPFVSHHIYLLKILFCFSPRFNHLKSN